MSLEPILVLIVVAVVANLVIMAALVASPTIGRMRGGGPPVEERPAGRSDRAMAAAAVVGHGDETAPDEDATIRTYDRVVRIASWVFLLAVTTIVGVTGLWPQSQTAIFLLLALGGVFVLVIHDLLPANALGPAKFVLEGSVAITVSTVLVALTGGAASPFFFVYPLIVGGAALVVSPPITLGLAIIAAVGYLLAVLLGSAPEILANPVTVATVGINLTAMVLLAYVAMVIAREQRHTRDAAIRLSTIDPLTALFNRGFFFAALEREIARSARSGRGFCLLMMDLDELKSINDRLGHFHGDRVLAAVGQVVSDGVRRIDTAARYGGDEFVVLLPETDPTGAFVVAEKIRIGVNELDLGLPDDAVRPSLSVGVVSYPDDGGTADELMISADRAMYTSKRAGKNRVTGVNVPDASGVASKA
ncbi:MAG TPA: GGDEF domain-containing protein [Candidatus Limnocylindrales bacterium]|nr:GGDEF domain-containing protein [Candidatus Limnocylindrales bacterium]